MGQANEIVVDAEYPSIEGSTEIEARHQDADHTTFIRRCAEITVQGSARDELVDLAPHIG